MYYVENAHNYPEQGPRKPVTNGQKKKKSLVHWFINDILMSFFLFQLYV